MARVNVEQIALTDSRFAHLGLILAGPERRDIDGLPLAPLGLGIMVYIWNECQERAAYVLPEVSVNMIGMGVGLLDVTLCHAVVTAGLGVKVRGGIRIKGTEGRSEWLASQREKNAIRQQKHRKRLSGSNALVTRDSQGSPAPAPAPAQVLKKEPPNPLRATRSVRDYPAGFLRAWQAFPHHGQRSVKRKALDVWLKDALEPKVEDVLVWIDAAKRTDDWKSEEGRFIPGMQVWLKGRDFADPPMRQEAPKPPERQLSPFATNNRLLTDDEKRERREREARNG